MLDISHQLVAVKLHFSVFEAEGSPVVSDSLVLSHGILLCFYTHQFSWAAVR